MNDLRFALRMLMKKPGFTSVAVLTLALGIGANTTVFSLVNAFLLRPMVGQREGELVQCYSRDTVRPDTYRPFSYPNYLDLREQNQVFSHLLAYELSEVGVTEDEVSRRVMTCLVSANYFMTFGITMARGRTFSAEEEQPGSTIPVVILSHSAWMARGGDPDILGKTLRIENRPHTIVGVAPPDFTHPMMIVSPQFWLPLGMHDALQRPSVSGKVARLSDRSQHSLLVVGQLKPGVTRPSADADLHRLAAQMQRAFPVENKDQTILVHPLPRLTIGPWPEVGSAGRAFVVGRITPMLFALAGAVHLIACLNLANLLLARASGRRKEIALRLALGAQRFQIMRQLLMEAALLSLLGGGVGLLLAVGSTRWFALSAIPALPYVPVVNATPDLRVLAATAGFCMLSTLLFGLVPAWRLSRPDLAEDLKERGSEPVSAGSGRGLFAMRNQLVIAQLMISLTLLITATLFIRGAINATRVNPGFELKNGLVVEVDAAMAGYDELRGRQTLRALAERLRGLPGVESVSLAASVPFGFRERREVGRVGVTPKELAKVESASADGWFGVDYNVVGADYFQTVRLPLVNGREFNPTEMEPGPATSVAVIDQDLANKLWPGEEALGRQLQVASGTPAESPRILEIVGVVPTLRNNIIESRPVPHLYVPWGREYRSKMYLHLRVVPRGRENELALLRVVRDAIRALDPILPVTSLKPLADLPKDTRDLWLVKSGAQMFVVFGCLALVLALVGVYGVKSFAVARRTREIGIRIALGATASKVLWMTLREGLLLTAVGLGLGVLLAAAAGRLLGSLLYGVSPLDPLAFTLAPLLLAATATLACYFPARRAAKVDPMVALRDE